MSRKFLDDHIRILEPRECLPTSSSTSYVPGHEFQDAVDGTIYSNLGTQCDGAIFRNDLANGVIYHEQFLQRPALNADIALVTSNKDFEVQG